MYPSHLKKDVETHKAICRDADISLSLYDYSMNFIYDLFK